MSGCSIRRPYSLGKNGDGTITHFFIYVADVDYQPGSRVNGAGQLDTQLKKRRQALACRF
jgi:hypothetical protein